MRVCVLRTGGTNCDLETKLALEASGIKADVVHVNVHTEMYDALVIPGGFSYGDHVRAGVIFARRAERILEKYVEAGRPILGICNGFQVLVEAGLLPGDGLRAALATNDSARFECRWVWLRHTGNCIFTKLLDKKVCWMPVAHAEGKFIALSQDLQKLDADGRIVFKYCDESGRLASGKYPLNPNGSMLDVAGVCDKTGLIFGLMPHPERAYWGWQLPDWTSGRREWGDGKYIFDSLASYLEGKI